MLGRTKDRKTERQRQETGESSAYLRSRRPVHVRPGLQAWMRRSLRWILVCACLAAIGLSADYALESYLRSEPRFLLPEDGVRLTGLHYLSPAKVQKVFAADAGTSIAGIPLEERQKELSEIAWVDRAAVLRVWPNRLWVHIDERKPVAFVRVPRSKGAETTRLIDRMGVFLDPPAGVEFTLPVIAGVNPQMPVPERHERIALFEKLIETIDSGDPPYSPLLSEIDVSDLRNVRVTTTYGSDVIDLQMGNDQFRHRYALFLKYIDGWKREFGKVRAVDLRFEGQVAVR